METQLGRVGLHKLCCTKHPEDGAAEGAPFIRDHMIRKSEKAFDDFSASGMNEKTNRKVLGLGD